MAVSGLRVYVESPNPTPNPRYGLFSVVPPLDLPVHARLGGLNYEISDTVDAHPLTVVCGPTASKTFDAGPTTINADPFVVYASLTCGTVGMDETRARDFLLKRLLATEQAVVESVFSQQANGQAPGLANNGGAVTLAAATTLTQAVSSLEQWLYQTIGYGEPGIIHVPAVAVAWMHQWNLISKNSDGVWVTPMGTRISMGNYSGLLPGGSAPAAGHTTLYITAEMGLWRDSEVFINPYGVTINKATNQFNLLAERNYILSIDTYVAGIDTTLAP